MPRAKSTGRRLRRTKENRKLKTDWTGETRRKAREKKDKEIMNKVVNELVKENTMIKVPVELNFKKKTGGILKFQATKILSLESLIKEAIRRSFRLRDK